MQSRTMRATLGVLGILVAIAAPNRATAQEITVTDQYGRVVTLAGPAERIVTIPIPAAAMLIAIDGGAERIAGMHALSQAAVEEGILGDFFPEAADIPSAFVGDGFVPNVEAVLQLEPDLVIQWGTRGEEIIQPLVDAGLDVVTLAYGTEEMTREWITLFGEVTGNAEKAERLIAWRDDVLARVEADLGGVTEADRPRVVYFLRFLSSLRVAGEDTYNDFYIELAGGVNPADGQSGWVDVNPEQVIAWDPEVILLNGFESALSPQDVYDNPLFAGVSAVRNNRVYQVPLGGYRWDPPNQESPLMWMWLAEVLHPESVDYPLRAEITEAYGWIYGQVPTQAQIDGVLRTEANAQARGYEVFAGGS
ncbi:MAG: ABC transporter substrate-binding protein [Azospirillaceae bacterium]